MRMVRVLAVALAVACIPLLASSAQRKATSGGRIICKLDSSARWYVKQREWLDDSRHAWSDDTLRLKLLRAAGLEQVRELPVQQGWMQPNDERIAGDSAMIAQLRSTAATRGTTWPTKSVVGAAGVRAVWLLSLKDTALARATLKRTMEAGPEESNSADVAMLEDGVRLTSGRKQIYGTRMTRQNGTLVLAPMEDSAHVDLRRDDAGLPPFKYSACLALKGP
ncbi:MAG: DUF6624 domain-containing protein [Gemmatimonadota bacterium]